jgi:hypothetical protein
MKVRSKIELIIVALLISSSCYAADVAQNAVADGSATVTGTEYVNGHNGVTSRQYTINSILALKTSVTGNAGSATNIGITDDTTTNATVYPAWVTTTTGNLPAKISSTKYSFNPSTGVLNAGGGILAGASTGVGLTGSNGSLALLGAGDGQDEDLKLDFNTTANTVGFSSTTGVTELNFSALNLATTGVLQGGVKISSDADGMDGTAMTAAGIRGTLFVATGAGTWTLPTAVEGMSACLMDSGTAHDLILDVQADDDIQLAGTEQANGVGITNASGSSTGDLVCVVAISAGHWATMGKAGTWASQ